MYKKSWSENLRGKCYNGKSMHRWMNNIKITFKEG